MGQSAAAWGDRTTVLLDRASRGSGDGAWPSARLAKVAEDGAGLLGVISDAAQQARVQTARADAAEARLREAEERHRRAEDTARASGRELRDWKLRSEAAERRAEELERHLKRAGYAVMEAESRLERALAEARAERERSGEIQRNSSETVERMRALLIETEDRLREATRVA